MFLISRLSDASSWLIPSYAFLEGKPHAWRVLSECHLEAHNGHLPLIAEVDFDHLVKEGVV